MRKGASGEFLSSASASVPFPGARPALLWSQLISSCPWYFGITNTLLVLSLRYKGSYNEDRFRTTGHR